MFNIFQTEISHLHEKYDPSWYLIPELNVTDWCLTQSNILITLKLIILNEHQGALAIMQNRIQIWVSTIFPFFHIMWRNWTSFQKKRIHLSCRLHFYSLLHLDYGITHKNSIKDGHSFNSNENVCEITPLLWIVQNLISSLNICWVDVTKLGEIILHNISLA